MSRRRHRRSQSGYALLVILFLGAVMAIMMLMSLPRAAFESQREKEDDLIYRGSQYSRAVQLFFRKNKRYPASIDDLEKFNNVRFLRRKYVDPITKKEEWRIIHVGPGGVFTDSLIYDRPKPKKEGEPDSGTPAGSTAASAPGAGSPGAPGSPFDPNQPQITGMADRLRGHPGSMPADGTASPDGVTPTGPTYYNVGQPGAFPAGGQAPFGGAPTQNSGNFGGSGPPSPFGTPAGPGTNTPFGAPGAAPGSGTPFQPSYPGGPIPGNPGAMPGGANSPFGAGSEAARIIGQILTTPRPGGLNGIPGTGTVSAFGGSTGFGGNSAFGGNTAFGGNGAFGGGGGAFGQPNQPGAFGQPNQAGAFGQPAGMGVFGGGNSGGAFGGGIAGVASKSEARGIKVYREHETYNEWEFVYDYRKDPVLMGGAAAMAGGAGMIPGQPGAMPGATPTSAFGQQGQSPFGGGAFGAGGFGQPGASGFGPSTLGQPSGFGSSFGQPGAFGQGGVGPNGQPITPINPGQPGLPSSPFGPPRSGAPTQQQQ